MLPLLPSYAKALFLLQMSSPTALASTLLFPLIAMCAKATQSVPPFLGVPCSTANFDPTANSAVRPLSLQEERAGHFWFSPRRDRFLSSSSTALHSVSVNLRFPPSPCSLATTALPHAPRPLDSHCALEPAFVAHAPCLSVL